MSPVGCLGVECGTHLVSQPVLKEVLAVVHVQHWDAVLGVLVVLGVVPPGRPHANAALLLPLGATGSPWPRLHAHELHCAASMLVGLDLLDHTGRASFL
eukprot:3981586-Pyramimonas_sp.AAC.1